MAEQRLARPFLALVVHRSPRFYGKGVLSVAFWLSKMRLSALKEWLYVAGNHELQQPYNTTVSTKESCHEFSNSGWFDADDVWY